MDSEHDQARLVLTLFIMFRKQSLKVENEENYVLNKHNELLRSKYYTYTVHRSTPIENKSIQFHADPAIGPPLAAEAPPAAG